VQMNPSVHTPAQGPTPTHIWDYWAVVMKRIVLVLLFVGACVGLAYFVTQRQQKLYRAQAMISILPPRSAAAGDMQFTPAIVNDDVYLATQLYILTTPETIQKAVKESNLANQPDFAGKSDAEIARMAIGKVETQRRRGLYLVDVSVTGPEPKVLDDLCNALVKTFQSMQKSESRQRREERRAKLNDEIQTAKSMIHLRENDRATALLNASFTNEATFESEWQSIQASREHFKKEAEDVYSDLLKDEPVARAFKDALADPQKGLASLANHPRILLNDRVKAVDSSIRLLRDQLDNKQRDGVLKNNPDYVKIQDQLDQEVRNRTHVVEDIVNTFLLENRNKSDLHESLEKKKEQKTQELTAAAAVKKIYDQRSDDIRHLEEDQKTAERQLETLVQNSTDDKDAVHIDQFASEPTTPYSPNSGTNLTLGLVFGIVGGIALAFLLEYLDDTIRTKDELAKIAPDVPLLGIVPNIEARKSEVTKKDLFAAHQPKSTISEAYRGVRTALTLSARGPQQRAMLLTSAGPREGKTTTAINLATVLAFSGARTLIIDADLRKPRIHASFNLPNKKGLTNLIVGEDDPADYCQRTEVERVDVLTSGPIPPNPSELLGRPRMREILRKLRDRYDQIIVDTPPIGAVTDAAVLATMVDGVILVVHAGKTRRQIVSRGIEQLRYISAPIIGVILNNLRLGRGRYYPGYYHYYYYYASHYGAEDGDMAPKKQKAGKAPPPATGADDATVG
jgi:succinoglycan biosynthesis transport protein ExoP